MSTHWRFLNTPGSPLSPDEARYALSEFQAASSDAATVAHGPAVTSKLAASRADELLVYVVIQKTLLRLQIPLCRTSIRLISDLVKKYEVKIRRREWIVRPGQPVIPGSDFIALLEKLKTIHNMWRSAVVSRSAFASQPGQDSPSKVVERFYADDLAEALEHFSIASNPSAVSIIEVEKVLSEVLGRAPTQYVAKMDQIQFSQAFSGQFEIQESDTNDPQIDVQTFCSELLTSDFVSEMRAECGAPAEDDIEGVVEKSSFELYEIADNVRAASRLSQMAMQATRTISQNGSVSPEVRDLKLPTLSSDNTASKPSNAMPDHQLCLASSVDVPKCPKNLRIPHDDTDSDAEKQSGRKSGRRSQRLSGRPSLTGRLGRFKSAVHQVMNMHKDCGLSQRSSTPQLSGNRRTSRTELPAMHQSTRSSGNPTTKDVAKERSVTARSVSPHKQKTPSRARAAVEEVRSSLSGHSILANPVFERYKKNYTKKVVQFR